MGLCPRVCCQDLEYLVTSFLYSFLFFMQRLILYKSCIPLGLDRIYIIPSNLPQSLFVLLHSRIDSHSKFSTSGFSKRVNRYSSGLIFNYKINLKSLPRVL